MNRPSVQEALRMAVADALSRREPAAAVLEQLRQILASEGVRGDCAWISRWPVAPRWFGRLAALLSGGDR